MVKPWKGRFRNVRILAIAPHEFDARRHRLPIAGELLLPGVQVYVRADGVVFALKQALVPAGATGTVIELCRRGEGVEVAVKAEKQDGWGLFLSGAVGAGGVRGIMRRMKLATVGTNGDCKSSHLRCSYC